MVGVIKKPFQGVIDVKSDGCHQSDVLKQWRYYRPQRSCEGYVFTSVCLSTGGEVPDQVHPPGPGTSPRTRYTPQDQVHPLGPGTPPWGLGTRDSGVINIENGTRKNSSLRMQVGKNSNFFHVYLTGANMQK